MIQSSKENPLISDVKGAKSGLIQKWEITDRYGSSHTPTIQVSLITDSHGRSIQWQIGFTMNLERPDQESNFYPVTNLATLASTDVLALHGVMSTFLTEMREMGEEVTIDNPVGYLFIES